MDNNFYNIITALRSGDESRILEVINDALWATTLCGMGDNLILNAINTGFYTENQKGNIFKFYYSLDNEVLYYAKFASKSEVKTRQLIPLLGKITVFDGKHLKYENGNRIICDSTSSEIFDLEAISYNADENIAVCRKIFSRNAQSYAKEFPTLRIIQGNEVEDIETSPITMPFYLRNDGHWDYRRRFFRQKKRQV